MKLGPLNCTWITYLSVSNPEQLSLMHGEGAMQLDRGKVWDLLPLLWQIGLATDLILGILWVRWSLLLPHLFALPKDTNCASRVGAKAVRSCTSVEEITEMPGRVSHMPRHYLTTVATHRWRKNTLTVFNCRRTLTAEIWGQIFGCYVQPFHMPGKSANTTAC